MTENASTGVSTTPSNPIKAFFQQEAVQKSIREITRERSAQFTTTILQIVNGSTALQKASPITIMSAALTAAALDLPINPNLGFAYLVPYKGQCAFQMGWKGYVQLAQRSGQYKTIHTTEIYQDQIQEFDFMSGEITLNQKANPTGQVVGYLAYFRLLNGFEKSLYMSKEAMTKHAKKYSQSYKGNSGVWADGEDGFNAMAKKTVLKLLIGRFGPMSVEMQKAVTHDQGVISEDLENVDYIDNQVEKVEIDKEFERIQLLIQDAKTTKAMDKFRSDVPEELKDLFSTKYDQLTIEGK